MAKFCANCGAPLEAGAKFCAECGTVVPETETVSPGLGANNNSNPRASANGAPQSLLNEEAVRKDLDVAKQEIDQAAQAAQRLADNFTGQAQRTIDSMRSDGELAKAMDFFSAKDKVAWYKANIMISKGRLNRLRYFTYSLLNSAMAILVWLVAEGIGGVISNTFVTLVLIAGAFIISLPIIASGIMLGIRRLHDMNQSGWLYLVTFIPYVGFVFAILIIFIPGTIGPNKYGPDPIAKRY